METNFDITTLGELLIDFTHIGKSASGMRVFEQNPGGAVANVAVAGARFGLKTAFIGKVGGDMHGHYLKSVLEAENVDTRNLIVDGDCFTTLAFVEVAENGDCMYSFYRDGSADVKLRADELDAELIRGSKILQLGTLSLTAEPSRSATLSAARIAKAANVIVSCDVNYRPSLWRSEEEFRQRSAELLALVDLLKVSESEAQILTGIAAPEAAAAELMSRFDISAVAVTLGESGAYVRTRNGGARVAGYPANAVDTSGAGDTFWTGFLFSLLQSGTRLQDLNAENAAEFARFGAAAASIVVESRGAIPSLPTLEQVRARMGAG
ncbi:MAG: carbohydrate kinase [Oscillospiraceae bacterium]|jgi:fructokinase|nr:carbohydrate kinase [Oscillospiraceae bacterium]